MTLQEQLSQINTAIEKIENGAQEYRLGSRMVRRADLTVLYKERRLIQQEIANEENSGGIYAASFTRGW
ncbi:hypothetical protein [uncultured Anaeromusa sp.]|uniref:hypothetical protein n=1 Tax=uncultured Anaeromusa sp. TaxID=673273 RepID=UPI0029C7D0D8|nr:hypothetical protein [uncultured Anaeromusa sp.]